MLASDAAVPVQTRHALLIAPFWGDATHVGSYRVDRFVRWLRSVDVAVTIVRAGPHPGVEIREWGVEMTVADPLHSVSLGRQRPSGGPARMIQLRRALASLVSPPDGRRVWAQRVAADPKVRVLARDATWIISSSPPESAHLAASDLARAFGKRHVVDMRDGWLDEPLKWLLQHSRFQRWREGRMERRVVDQADRVFVVSDVLGEMLAARIPGAAAKTAVLTNSGPPTALIPLRAPTMDRTRPLQLLYAGRFTGSNRRQRAAVLLDALTHAARARPSRAAILLLGQLEHEDLVEIRAARPALEDMGWSVSVSRPVPHGEAQQAMVNADGLLLLAMGRGVLTSKLFEYLSSGRPILAVTIRDGALWRLGAKIPHLFLVDAQAPDRAVDVVPRFLEAAASDRAYPVPPELSDEALRRTFLSHIGAVDQ